MVSTLHVFDKPYVFCLLQVDLTEAFIMSFHHKDEQ